MLHFPRCIAPALLASAVGLIGAARAEPAPAASSASAECLAKPNATAAAGNHWYYRLDRASGRKCWYQRPASGAQTDEAKARPPARAIVSPPADTAAPAPVAEQPAEVRDQNTYAPAAATRVTAAPAQPYSWTTAAPAPVPAPAPQVAAPASESVAAAPAPLISPAPAPAISPAPEALAASPQAEPAPALPVTAPTRVVPVERTSGPVDDDSHMPALLGAAIALVIIVLGSIVARFVSKLVRSRRRRKALHATAATIPPMYPAEDAPDLVPVMPREDIVVSAMRSPRVPIDDPFAPRRAAANRSDDAVAQSGDAQALDENVRELLRRLRNELPATPPPAPKASVPQPKSAEELDQVLAMWREGRRRRAT